MGNEKKKRQRAFTRGWRLWGDTLKFRFSFARTPSVCFIWIPKTAGTTLYHEFNRELGMKKLKFPRHYMAFPNYGAVTFVHVHYLSLLETGIVSRDYHQAAFKFTVVRNPYSRAVSLYNYLITVRKILPPDTSFDAFLDHVMYRRSPIGTYNVSGFSQTNPQVDWLLDGNGDFIVDRVYKLEELTSLRDEFAREYNVDLNIGSQRNVSGKVMDLENDLFSRRDRTEKVNAIYARDFHLLDYEMRDPAHRSEGTA